MAYLQHGLDKYEKSPQAKNTLNHFDGFISLKINRFLLAKAQRCKGFKSINMLLEHGLEKYTNLLNPLMVL